ncbi:MAG: hypothetical protein IRZ33_08370 [Alicyclobacillaceae bacterium]|nr:hypothetical protein [Alicyclobacillaceae bacterium]
MRTVRRAGEEGGQAVYEVRVAPHPVAPFRGGPWIRRFSEAELEEPGEGIAAFRAAIAEEIRRARAAGPG